MRNFRLSRLALAALGLTLLAGAGCGGSGTVPGSDAGPMDAAFELRLLDDSYLDGGSLDSARVVATAVNAELLVTVEVSGADGLKALYCDLDYDAARFSLRSAVPAGGFGAGQEVLNLHQTTNGVVHYGQVIAGTLTASGFSGDGPVAKFRFSRHPEAAPGRRACMVPLAESSAVPLNWETTTGTLTWDYYHQGDYNQDGLVTVSDLTPLGVNYDTAGPFPDDSALSCVDGNNDGYITVSDITPIGANYNSQVSGYYVFASDDPGRDYPETPGELSAISARAALTLADNSTGDKATDRLSFSHTLAAPVEGDSYWVRPVDGENEGIPSNIVNDQQWRSWDTDIVDQSGDTGYYVSLDLDSNDQPHICYFDKGNGDLKYAWFNGFNWQSQVVDSENNTGWFCSLDLDSADVAHIAYHDNTAQDLKYAVKPADTWLIETISSEGNVGQFTDIVVDSNDRPCVVYIDEFPTGNLYLARHNGTGWDIETVDDSQQNGGYCSIALDSADEPHISYHIPEQLRYAYWDGSEWVTTAIRWFEVGKFTSIALDSSDNPHITCFHEWTREGKYSMWDGADWQHDTFDSDGDAGWCTSLVLGADDQPQISYTEGGSGDLRFARRVEGSWVTETVVSAGNTGYNTSLKLDSQGNPHIAYSDLTDSKVYYATP